MIAILIIGTLALAIKTISSFLVANLYDLKQINLNFDQKEHPHKKIYRNRPLISLFISSYNDELHITECLDSITKGSYKKVEIFVTDSNSSDSTKAIVKEYISTHPKHSIKLIVRRSNEADNKIIRRDIKKYALGDIVMVLDAKDVLEKQSLKSAINLMNLRPTISAVNFKEVPINDYSIGNLINKYLSFSRSRLSKVNDYLGINLNQSNTLYKKDTLLNLLSIKNNKLVYAQAYSYSSIVYKNSSINIFSILLQQTKLNFLNLKQEFTRYKLLPLAIVNIVSTVFTPLFISYILYMAVKLHEPTLLTLSLILISSINLISIWQDNKLAWNKKIVYSVTIPITFIFYYLISIFELIRALTLVVWPKVYFSRSN
jgi:glycosyltransferase involved in cell wall biosynthesis